jgi:hypothetical protein
VLRHARTARLRLSIHQLAEVTCAKC